MALPDSLLRHLDRRHNGSYTLVGNNAAQISGAVGPQELDELDRATAAAGCQLRLVSGVLVVASPNIIPSVQGGGGGTVISSTLLSSDAAALTLSGLDLSAWTHVRLVSQVRASLATEGAGNWERLFLRFNSDSGANYLWSTENDDGTPVNNTTPGYISGIFCGHAAGPNMAAGQYGLGFADLMLPGSTTSYKNLVSHNNIPYQTQTLSTSGGGIWKNTAAITRLDVIANDGGNLLAGSRLILVGVA